MCSSFILHTHTHTHTHAYIYFLLHFRFWGTCAGHARLLHRYIHGNVVCCLHPLLHLYLVFLPTLSLPRNCPSPSPPQLTTVCDAPLPGSMCSNCSTPTNERYHAVFDFLFWCQFAENDGFQIHPCPYKGHELIIFYGCILFHGVYVPYFPRPVYH